MAPTIQTLVFWGFVFESQENRFANLHEHFIEREEPVILIKIDQYKYAVVIYESLTGHWFSIRRPMGMSTLEIKPQGDNWDYLIEDFVKAWERVGADFKGRTPKGWKLVTLNDYYAAGCCEGYYSCGEIM